ncbi:MAG: hypothetical protein AB1439_04220 [candidate division FCPU426 bacterium]
MKRLGTVILAFWILLAGCGQQTMPQRNVDFENPSQVAKSLRDYNRLERKGVETIVVKTHHFTRIISLSFYLYLLAQAFEQFGRDQDAEKLYIHLLIQYPVLHDNSQLGVMTENRLYWLLGDKRWVMPSVDELILKLEYALLKQDEQALQALISRDFGFGRSYEERFAVKYQEGVHLLAEEMKNLHQPVVEIYSKDEDNQVVLKTSGWENGKKTWYFSLRHNPRAEGWEWDMAYWEHEPMP